MLQFYQPPAVQNLRLSDRSDRLRRELLDAPERYSDTNARITQRVYKKHAALPVVLRRAKALEALFTEMPVYIRPGELLVGNRSEGLGVMPVLPAEYQPADPTLPRRQEQFECLGLHEDYRARLDDAHKAVEDCLLAGYPAGRQSGFGHILADYSLIVRKGALALAQEAETRQAAFAAAGKQSQADFCQAAAISLRAFAAWGRRYAALAANQAEACADPSRKQELLDIAQVCSQVPALPARSFREGLQAYFFAHQAMLVEQQGGSISIGGFDRVLHPYYQRDMESGTLNTALATELVEGFYIKLMENAIWPRKVVNFCNMTIGGMDAEGADQSNDLTWLALDTTAKTGSTHPLLSFRWHPGVDRTLWQRVVDVIGLGRGLPAVFSDLQMMAALESWGIPRQTAAEYGVVGCVEPALTGLLHGQTLGAHVNLVLCLELALNDGRRIGHSERLGPATGNLRDFTGMDDVWRAYTTQVAYACNINRDCVYATAETQKTMYAYPLMSALMDGAIENGRDLTHGVRYNFPTVCITGVTNVVDSMLALEEQLAQDPGAFATMQDALHANFAGHEALRQQLLASRQHFGNGDPAFAQLYNKVCNIHQQLLQAMPGPRGDYFTAGLWPVEWHVLQGQHTAASPDGRLAGTPIADGAGPISGRPVHSPTGVIRDMAAVDAAACWPGGYVFNLKFSSSLFASPAQAAKVASFIEAFFQMGGMQMQVNTISRQVLQAAQQSPEEYKDLVVRVAGYSAYFTNLIAATQNEIIAREQVEG